MARPRKRRSITAQQKRELVAAARCSDMTLGRLLNGRPIRESSWLRIRDAAERIGLALNVEPRIAA